MFVLHTSAEYYILVINLNLSVKAHILQSLVHVYCIENAPPPPPHVGHLVQK